MILIDDRDGSRPLADLPPLDGFCSLTRLEWGDAMLTGHGPDGSTISVGVEVKSIHDLLSSISTGRLGATQVPKMLESYDYSFLLYYGVYRPNPVDNLLQVRRGKSWKQFKIGRRAVPYSYLEGFLITAEMFTPIRVRHLYDVNEVACWLRVMDHWLEKPWDKHKALSVFDKSGQVSAPPNVNPVEAQIARTAASFPAIDFIKGWKIAKHFDSVGDFIAATPSRLAEVAGIGPVISRSTYDAIRRRKNGQGEDQRSIESRPPRRAVR